MVYKIFPVKDLTSEQFASYMNYLTEAKKRRLIEADDSLLVAKAVVAEMLARQCLSELCEAPEFSFQLLLNIDSKSAVTNFDANISLSECDGYIACCASKKNVGIALSKPQGFSFGQAQRLFSDSEIRYMFSESKQSLAENVKADICDEKSVTDKFAALYSLKRAYFYSSGRTIMTDMQKINFEFSGNSISCSDERFDVVISRYSDDIGLYYSIVERS